MTALEALATGICPSCRSSAIEIQSDYISCRTCGIHGNPKEMTWCDTVPIFREVHKDEAWRENGQLYEYKNRLFVLTGHSMGCGRVVSGIYCDSCRSFMPEKTSSLEKPRKRHYQDAKSLATGERE